MRTSSRLATFAHATSRTITMDPISTQSTLPMSPITSILSGWRVGVKLACSNIFTPNPGGGGKLCVAIGTRRVKSAVACCKVTPGFRRARPLKRKPASTVLLRSICAGTTTSTSERSMNSKFAGRTPMISCIAPSSLRGRPTTEASPPKWRCQKP